jgi:hypothetical protein
MPHRVEMLDGRIVSSGSAVSSPTATRRRMALPGGPRGTRTRCCDFVRCYLSVAVPITHVGGVWDRFSGHARARVGPVC